MTGATSDAATADDDPLEFGPVTRRIWGCLAVGLTLAVTAAWMWIVSVPGRDLLLVPLIAVLVGILIGTFIEFWKWFGRVRAGRRPPFPVAVTCIALLVAGIVAATVGNVPARLRFETHREGLDAARVAAQEMIDAHPDRQAASFGLPTLGMVHAEAVPGGVHFRTGVESTAGYTFIGDPAIAAEREGMRSLGGDWYLDPG